MNFTFKKMERTGRYKSFQLDYTEIKLKKKIVGSISETKDGNFRIMFHVARNPTKKDPAPFHNIHVKKEFEREKDAREYLTDNFERILARFTLHPID